MHREKGHIFYIEGNLPERIAQLGGKLLDQRQPSPFASLVLQLGKPSLQVSGQIGLVRRDPHEGPPSLLLPTQCVFDDPTVIFTVPNVPQRHSRDMPASLGVLRGIRDTVCLATSVWAALIQCLCLGGNHILVSGIRQ